ncbi:hypothetical protein [Roseibium aggregatum]|uniref:Uncharacterized protein n=1 Tax=Roseibium aggregatum TaxID=187304 RepID=A0A926S5H4_9HYPH|nr:hypothetical protein [Roseibium aggregatum]MBD1547463.1 hypothetical protein [Roseibium aggregatum]
MRMFWIALGVMVLSIFSGPAGAADLAGQERGVTDGPPLLAQSERTDQSASQPSAKPFAPVSSWIGAAVAQSCPSADPGEALCGYFNGYCRYCDTKYPHYCPSNNTCYQYFTGAQEACGNSYVICGGPVQ